MTEIVAPKSGVPFLKSSEEQVSKIRRQLEAIYKELDLVQDLLLVCRGACGAEGTEVRRIDHVLRRCGSDRLLSVQKTLASLIERFGGNADVSDRAQEGTQ